jgi:hypothetical protein
MKEKRRLAEHHPWRIISSLGVMLRKRLGIAIICIAQTDGLRLYGRGQDDGDSSNA